MTKWLQIRISNLGRTANSLHIMDDAPLMIHGSLKKRLPAQLSTLSSDGKSKFQGPSDDIYIQNAKIGVSRSDF